MAVNRFSFDPEDGFLDNTFYEETPPDSRETLQRQHNQTRDFINSLVDTLNSTELGQSGSESIKSPQIEGINGDNVYLQIKDIKRQISDVVIDSVPDASITNAKLANSSVSSEKIADNSINSNHFDENAICPFANEPIKINGFDKSDYEPIKNISALSLFKKRVTDTPISSIYGKNIGSFRYIVHNRKVMRLNLENGEFTQYADLSYLNTDDIKIAFDENGTLYYADSYLNSSDNYYYLKVSKFEDDEYLPLKNIKLFQSTGYTCNLADIEIFGQKLYFAMNYVYSTNYYTYCYEVLLDNIPITDFLTPFFSKRVDNRISNMFISDSDLFVGPYAIRNCNAQTYDTISGEFICANNNADILVYHSNNIILENLSLLPKVCTIGRLPDYVKKSFLYNKYIYTLIGSYLFKTRIF